jgi:NADH-quinone oxidoreductase subunit H
MDRIDVLIIVLTAIAAFALWLICTALLIWGERRLVAKMQQRIGPNRLGPLGLFQTVADGAKLFFKEDITPRNVDKAVYIAAPFISAVVAMLTFAVIPFGGTFAFEGREVALQVWDPNIGLLWVLAMSSLGVYGIVLAGWASGSKYPLLGGVRSSAQMISYELAMGLSLAAVFIHNGTLRSSGIVAAQSGLLFGFLPAWNLVPMIPAFVIFFVAVVAETQRPPFDLPEAEGELVAGFHTEYSGAKFAMFFLAEFMNVITVSAVTVTAFLGGPSGPVPDAWEGRIAGALLGVVYFLLKTFVFIFVFVWLRATLPRTRYDRLMDLGWKVMLPFSLAWVMITAAVMLYRQQPLTGSTTRVLLIVALVAAVLWFIAPIFSSGKGDRGAPAQPESAPDDTVDEVQI